MLSKPDVERTIKQPTHLMPVEFGNATAAFTGGTGWFIGFSDWSKHAPHDLRYMPQDAVATGLCVKWFAHTAGDPNGEAKPVSTGRTISILVSECSDFRLDFSFDPDFPPESTQTLRLRRAGDFAIWGAGVFHRSFGVQAGTIMTVRWEVERSTS